MYIGSRQRQGNQTLRGPTKRFALPPDDSAIRKRTNETTQPHEAARFGSIIRSGLHPP
jgi:hypothetical protein